MLRKNVNVSFAEAEFSIMFSFSILSAWILSGVFLLPDDLLLSELMLEFEFIYSFAIVELREKCRNMELFLVRIFLYSD